MVNKKIPRTLVARFKKIGLRGNKKYFHTGYGFAVSDWQSLMRRLKNSDSRYPVDAKMNYVKRLDNILERIVFVPGVRVREFDVSRNYPHLGKVVIKVSHGKKVGDMTSQDVINAVNKKVEKYNSSKEKVAVLRKPFAYAISRDLILMAKTNFLPVNELFYLQNSEKVKKYFYEKGVSFSVVQKALNQIKEFADIKPQNLFFAGLEKGKPVFVAMADLF